MLCRPTTALFGIASLAALAMQRRWRELAASSAALLVSGIALLAYNTHYFGFEYAFSGGYLGAARTEWTTPLFLGLAGLLFAPSRGLLIYTPAVLMVPFGIGRLFEGESLLGPQRRIVLGTWLAAAFVTIAVYSKRTTWWGGWSYGPRYLCEIIPILAIFFALASLELHERYGRKGSGLAWVLVVVSIAVQFAGVFGHDSAWMARNSDAASTFPLRDNQIISNAKTIGAKKPLALLLPGAVIPGLSLHPRCGHRQRGRRSSLGARPQGRSRPRSPGRRGAPPRRLKASPDFGSS